MTKIKLCGLTRPCDIEAANALHPNFIGFVFAPKSRRYVSPEAAAALRRALAPGIAAVGVFVRESPERIAQLLSEGVIDIAQLHGGETDADVARLRALTSQPIWQAFRIDTAQDIARAEDSAADLVLLDSGSGGTGTTFDWQLIQRLRRPYLLAGGLSVQNVGEAVRTLHPYGVDVSSGIETDGLKDRAKMAAFVEAVRRASGKEDQP